MVPPEARIQADVLHRAFRLGRLAVLYPDLFKSLLLWLLLVMVLIVPAAAVLPRVERFRVRDLSMWLWLAGGASFVALGLHGLSQLVGTLRHQAPPIVDFAQASSLVMLPLYVLFAQALTNLFRLVRTHRALLRWACAAFMAGWMLPSDNLQAARHMVYRWASALMEADQQPLRFQEITVKRAKDAELAEIAFWARHNTDKDAVFLTGSVEFRMLSRRAIVVSQDDVKYFYYVTPWELEEWIWRMARQSEVLSPPAGEASEQAISQFVDELKNRGYREVAGWYVILPAEAAPDAPGALEPITAQGWGQHYRLYRVG
jgi:hypothetical protein